MTYRDCRQPEKVEVVFITYDPNRSTSLEEQERARALAHAARIGWRRSSKSFTSSKPDCADSTSATSMDHSKACTDKCDIACAQYASYLDDCSGQIDHYPIDSTPEIDDLVKLMRNVIIPQIYAVSRPLSSKFRKERSVDGGQTKFGSLHDSNTGTPHVHVNGHPHYTSPNDTTPYATPNSGGDEVQELPERLDGECTALALLAGWISLMAPMMPDRGIWARATSLKLRSRATTILRYLVEQHTLSGHPPRTLLTPLSEVFFAECMAGNSSAAASHAQLLAVLLGPGCYTPELSLRVMCGDLHLATVKTERTFFSFNTGYWKVISLMLNLLERRFPRQNLPFWMVHPAVSFGPLRDIFLRRHYFASTPPEAFLASRGPLSAPTADDFFLYLLLNSLMDLGQLINIYADIVEGYAKFKGTLAQHNLQAALAIGIHYMTLRQGHMLVIEGLNHPDASDEMMLQLQLSLGKVMIHASVQEMDLWQDALLWLLYAGTVYERHKASLKATNDDSRWFTTQLRTQARLSRITNWHQMQRAAEQFFYSPAITPDGSCWFDELIGNDIRKFSQSPPDVRRLDHMTEL